MSPLRLCEDLRRFRIQESIAVPRFEAASAVSRDQLGRAAEDIAGIKIIMMIMMMMMVVVMVVMVMMMMMIIVYLRSKGHRPAL